MNRLESWHIGWSQMIVRGFCKTRMARQFRAEADYSQGSKREMKLTVTGLENQSNCLEWFRNLNQHCSVSNRRHTQSVSLLWWCWLRCKCCKKGHNEGSVRHNTQTVISIAKCSIKDRARNSPSRINNIRRIFIVQLKKYILKRRDLLNECRWMLKEAYAISNIMPYMHTAQY